MPESKSAPQITLEGSITRKSRQRLVQNTSVRTRKIRRRLTPTDELQMKHEMRSGERGRTDT